MDINDKSDPMEGDKDDREESDQYLSLNNSNMEDNMNSDDEVVVMNSSDSESDFEDHTDFVDNMLEGSLNGIATGADEPPCKMPRLDDDNSPDDEDVSTCDDLLKLPKHSEKKRMMLIKRDQDYFEILPEGWVEITHFSGMPVYLHKETRVCTLSKPYLLGAGSARKHDIPISSIPCLQYKRELQKEPTNESSEPKTAEMEQDLNSAIAGVARVETLKDSRKDKSINHQGLRDYCMNLFEFKEVTIRKFKTWADRRKHAQIRKLTQRPSLPQSTKLITCTMPKNAESTPGKPSKKEFIMNPAGKSVVCILHEFVQHTGRTQPKYKFQELENVAKPYSATVIINDMEYGKGYGSSKKEAKTEAARASLNILIPDLQKATEGEQGKTESDDLNDLSFFDNIRIEDPRVGELCLKAGQYSPYQILVECLRRHYGVKDLDVGTEVKLLKHQKNEYKMKVGEHEATVICKNKREGKQRAAQSILQKLHTNLNSWGALLKLYGRGSCKTPKEKKEEAQQITELQSLACSNQPNFKILEKLREEMLKLKTCPASVNIAPINSIHFESSDGSSLKSRTEVKQPPGQFASELSLLSEQNTIA